MQFSGTFMNHLQHIENWRMDNDFFVAFPELYDDITPTDTISRGISCTLSQRRIDKSGIASNIGASEQEWEDAGGCLWSTSNLAPIVLDPWNEAFLEFTSDNVATWP